MAEHNVEPSPPGVELPRLLFRVSVYTVTGAWLLDLHGWQHLILLGLVFAGVASGAATVIRVEGIDTRRTPGHGRWRNG